jgi:hypothetical protein
MKGKAMILKLLYGNHSPWKIVYCKIWEEGEKLQNQNKELKKGILKL